MSNSIKYPPVSYDIVKNKRGGLKRTNFFWNDEDGRHARKMSRREAAEVNRMLPSLPRTKRQLEERKRRHSSN